MACATLSTYSYSSPSASKGTPTAFYLLTCLWKKYYFKTVKKSACWNKCHITSLLWWVGKRTQKGYLFISIVHGLKPDKSVRRYIHGICSFCSLRLLCVNVIFNLQSYFYSLQSFDEVNIITSHLQIKTESCRRLHNLLKVMSRSRGGAWTQFCQNSKPAHSPSITSNCFSEMSEN